MNKELNELKGNPGQRTAAPHNFGQAPLDAPSWLDRMGKLFWRKIAPPLSEEGLLNPVTYDLVASCCAAYSTYREAHEILKKEGRVITTKTTTKVNPWAQVESKAWDQMIKTFERLGVVGNPIQAHKDDLELFLEKEAS